MSQSDHLATEPPASAQVRKRRSRRELLLDGHRVTIADLVEAGLLRVGDRLTCREQHAEITERGRMRLQDGREFDTPSPATSAVFGGGSFPGWFYWTTDDGKNLDHLRQELLTTVAKEAAANTEPDDPETGTAETRFEQLKRLYERALAGNHETMTVRELLRLWQLDDRDRAASTRVDADLENHGLMTQPDYHQVSLDHSVQVVLAPTSVEEASTQDSTGHAGTVSASAETIDPTTVSRSQPEATSAEIGITVGILLDPKRRLVFVSREATLAEAITKMQLDDYSQLAVMNGKRTLVGVVTWKSIAEARHRDRDATLADATNRNVVVLKFSHRLLDAIEIISSAGFVLVEDPDKTINGIVTAADVIHRYDEDATPFFLTGEIDQELRQLIQARFDEQMVADTLPADAGFKSFNEMTMGQYRAVLENKEFWAELNWPLDRKAFIDRLIEVNEIRNRVAHFNPDPVGLAEVHKLRHFLGLLRMYSQ